MSLASFHPVTHSRTMKYLGCLLRRTPSSISPSSIWVRVLILSTCMGYGHCQAILMVFLIAGVGRDNIIALDCPQAAKLLIPKLAHRAVKTYRA